MDNGTILQNYKDRPNNNNSYTYSKVVSANKSVAAGAFPSYTRAETVSMANA